MQVKRNGQVFLGVIVLCGFSAVSAAQCGARVLRPYLSRPYRGVVEGEGAGFVEQKADTPPADQEVLSAIDLAHGLLNGTMSPSAIGQYSISQLNHSIIEAFETHMSDYPEDWYSMREYALALILDKQYEQGFKTLKASYLGDPALVRIPLNVDLLGEDGGAMNKLAKQLVRYAKKHDSGDAWFAVTMILQAKGDIEHAITNLERATKSGFEKQIGDGMHDGLIGNRVATKEKGDR